MYPGAATWLVSHPVFRNFTEGAPEPQVLVSYAEGFAPVVNSVPTFLHLTLSRSDARASLLLREIWNDELGLSGTKAHPVLFDELYCVVTTRWGKNGRSQEHGIAAAIKMIRLCGSGKWPIGVAAMKAHESQFPTAYSTILPVMEGLLGMASEFFRVHSEADVEHTKAGDQLLRHGISEGIVSPADAEQAFESSTQILRELMDAIWQSAHP